MHGNLEPEENVMYNPLRVKAEIARAIETLGWDELDEITVEIGGTSVSGIDVGEDYNKKWQSPLGTRKYNKDAFIIIKNQARRDLDKPQPMEEFKPRHPHPSQEVKEEDGSTD